LTCSMQVLLQEFIKGVYSFGRFTKKEVDTEFEVLKEEIRCSLWLLLSCAAKINLQDEHDSVWTVHVDMMRKRLFVRQLRGPPLQQLHRRLADWRFVAPKLTQAITCCMCLNKPSDCLPEITPVRPKNVRKFCCHLSSAEQ
jgi:hypothetical protein